MPHGIYPRRPVAELFWDRVDRFDPDWCWDWTGAHNRAGYGVVGFRSHGRSRLAHRFSYELNFGLIPEGLTIDHLCNNPGCVNPKHLEAVPIGVNIRRGNTISTVNGKKTHCKHGHEFNDENTFHDFNVDGKPRRQCRPCNTARRARYVAAKKEVA